MLGFGVVEPVNALAMDASYAALDSIHGAEAAGVAYLGQRREITVRAQTADLISVIDDLQPSLQEGPCMATMTGTDRVRVDDFATEIRWPELSRSEVDLGSRSALSFRLYLSRDTHGALSLFSSAPDAFDESSGAGRELFATHAAVAIGGARRDQQFNVAVRQRDVIGQAKGFLMARYGIDEDQAFATLAQFSQQEHIKLYDVAVRLMRFATVTDEGADPAPAEDDEK
jgi:hypothetical protein